MWSFQLHVSYACLRGEAHRTSFLMGRAEIGKVGEKVDVVTYVVSGHFSVGNNRNEDIHDVVRESAAIARVRRRLPGII